MTTDIYYSETKEAKKQNTLLRFLKALNIIYSERKDIMSNEQSITKNSINNINKIKENHQLQKDINNYIYFTGQGSSFSLSLNYSSVNINTNFPTLENGCSIVFWINIDQNVLSKYLNLNKNIGIYLVTINIGEHQIKLKYSDINKIKFIIDETESNEIDISNSFLNGQWNHIAFLITQKSRSKQPALKVVINGVDYYRNEFLIPKDFNLSEQINTIKLFENF